MAVGDQPTNLPNPSPPKQGALRIGLLGVAGQGLFLCPICPAAAGISCPISASQLGQGFVLEPRALFCVLPYLPYLTPLFLNIEKPESVFPFLRTPLSQILYIFIIIDRVVRAVRARPCKQR